MEPKPIMPSKMLGTKIEGTHLGTGSLELKNQLTLVPTKLVQM